MKIAISAESTIDLTNELLEQYQINTIPFQVLLGENEYKDGEVLPKDIFEFVSKTKKLPKTSAINSVQYKEYFETLLKENDAVIHICLSSKISSSYSHAVDAANETPNVYIVDSKSLSTGIALLAIFARNLTKADLNVQDVYNQTVAQVENVQASFVIDRLDYLYKGGRCSMLSLLGANLLKIHPQILLQDGSMKVHKKYRGKLGKVVEDYCNDIINEFNDANLDTAFLTYTTATEEMKNIAKTALKQKGFKNIYETTAGSTVTSHCGENTLGILYLCNTKI